MPSYRRVLRRTRAEQRQKLDPVYSCDDCGREYKTERGLQQHQERGHE